MTEYSSQTDTRLKNILVWGTELDPVFNPNVLNYTAVMPAGGTKIHLSLVPMAKNTRVNAYVVLTAQEAIYRKHEVRRVFV